MQSNEALPPGDAWEFAEEPISQGRFDTRKWSLNAPSSMRSASNAHEHTLADVAERLGVSRERVRQIEKQAMQRLQRRRGHTGAPPAAA